MGLDIYLRRCKNLKAYKAYEAKKEKYENDFFEKENKKTPDNVDWKVVEKATAAWVKEHPAPADSEMEEISKDSSVNPKHMFKVGYLRSSYNDGGINSVLRENGFGDLYHIFFGNNKDPNEYYVRPDWEAALKRAREIRDGFSKKIEKDGAFFVYEASLNPFMNPAECLVTDKKAALEVFLAEKARKDTEPARPKDDPFAFSAYSNREGYFTREPMQVFAILDGTKKSFTGEVVAATYVVAAIAPDKKGEKPMAFYNQALEITVEMIEWVLSQPNPDEYCLAWSG